MAELILKLKEREIKRINIHGLQTVIGRDPNCDLFIDNPAISREHATIIYRGGKFFIKDNNSSNGTFLNGQKITGEQQLKDGDEIFIGKYKIIFSSAGGIPEHLLLNRKKEETRKNRPKDVFGTIQFSQDEIKQLIQTAKNPVSPSNNLELEVKSSEPADKQKQLLIAMGVIIALLILILIFVIISR